MGEKGLRDVWGCVELVESSRELELLQGSVTGHIPKQTIYSIVVARNA